MHATLYCLRRAHLCVMLFAALRVFRRWTGIRSGPVSTDGPRISAGANARRHFDDIADTAIAMTATTPRTPDHPIDSQFPARWSPRAFTPEALPEATLHTFFEAARWAPSSYNSQPWRFVYARRDTTHWNQFLGFLNEFNQSWAKEAAAIVIVISKTTFVPPGGKDEVPAPTHSFDTGSAWGYFALQASLAGWGAHGLAGIDRDKIRTELKVPPQYAIEAAVAIGRPGDPASLPEGLQKREFPSPREPLSKLVAEGHFPF